MPDTTFFIQQSSRLSALKSALLDERRALGLDTPTSRARADGLLGEGRGETFPASEPIVVVATDQALL